MARDNISRNRRDILKLAGASGTVGIAGLAGCLGGGGGDGDGGGKNGNGSNKPIKLGAVYYLSGIGSVLALPSKAGAKLGVEQVNDAGGILGRDVEITFRDHAGSTQKAIQHLKELVLKENVDGLIGLTSSGVTLGSAPTIAQLGAPMMLTDTGTPFITTHNYEKYGNYYKEEDGQAAGQPNIFRTNPNLAMSTYCNAKWAFENLDVKRVANMGMNYVYGEQCWDYFKEYSNSLGADYKYVASELTDVGASNMVPAINKVLAADPDLVFTSYWGGDAVTFAQQAISQGMFEQTKMVLDTIGADPYVLEPLGDSMPEGQYYSGWYWHSAYKNKENKEFVKAFYDKYKDNDTYMDIPGLSSPSSYSAIWWYKKAMEKAGTTNYDDVIAALESGLTLQSPLGELKIDPETHQANVPHSIGATKYIDGQGTDGVGPGVPYDGASIKPSKHIRLDSKTASELLGDSKWPAGFS